jgi:hypothetical protein
MDRAYIDNEHIVDRYLSGDLTVKEARAFEQYCREHPEFLQELPIPVRLKARLARPPATHSETGMFKAIPSSATHAAAEAAEEGFDEEEEERSFSRRTAGSGRLLLGTLVVALIAALGAAAMFAMRANRLQTQIDALQRETSSTQMQAPGGVQTYRIAPVRAQPERATLHLGWQTPPQLLELYVDVSEGKFTQFQITVDKVDGGRLMQVRRLTRDSNRELRLALNSSAFGPGDYLIRIDAYNWRGQTQEYGWLRLGLQ